MRILVVDDSRTIRAIQRKVLAQLGYTQVWEAGDGEEALARLSECNPELVLVDLTMPIMDGLTLIRRIREREKEMPIILVATETEKPKVMDALGAGANACCIKPFSAESLAEVLRQILPSSAVAAQ